MKDSNDKLNIFTSLEDAITEARRRKSDPILVQAVHDFLDGDIPEHFLHPEPILYLARHVATPNYEALRFIELTKDKGLPIVISQDTKGKFVSNNPLKRTLGKLPITKGFTSEKGEIVEYITIVDFTEHQGKSLREVNTKHNVPLVEYHNSLFQHIYPNTVTITDEADWIDRNHRDDIKKQYTKMLALLVTHGVMFESYPPEETHFLETVVKPSFEEIVNQFGVAPLIVEHIDEQLETTKDWNGYPSVLYRLIKDGLAG